MTEPASDDIPVADCLPTIWGWAGLKLRWLTAEDTPALLEIFSDPEVVRYTSLPVHETEADIQRLLDDIQRGFRDGSLFQWGIEIEGRIIGTCTLARIDRAHQRAEVGFILGRAFWGQRVMSRALPLLIAFAFDQLKLHRLEADADPRNTASIRILERAGFQREGLMRERYWAAGEWQDAVIYGLLASERGRTGGHGSAPPGDQA
jgi:[ribosomal protein S5]-alanine N-acetyltransferase